MTQEALKLALEHIEGNYTVSAEEAIAAIKEALAQPEPCDMGVICIGCSPRNADGSCPSSQRTWVGLFDDEIMQIWGGIIKYAPSEVRIKYFARAIESKLKEVNT